ncbi:MAG: hypothetical protein A3G49_04645 [Candidatus Sungbacteria bacterium RIFCSPLOWO2_12_FULL_41_11]|uniref:POTRA domain-containing protein n=1 Tax=Candidatus Sungbacteria bacterium RIFCSPLOWO2_12_FULL_41_11 TaxID=1802286 RepID=A0A1G2LND3_9BACT|nr:MAG: hypothetical protein UV01_C0002G0075 [Parcubacteria group bacterium GW2011_GWA2_42_14]OGZ99567.1 MAG: hypothetical protein A3D41_01095 [Candidatus Sungbacteria bacterium RIFCSPHIGHO2_02_FULL_41_12b]OHA13120.1 MAG: hypothetical protein A3G49_04645 [Candidatus Sungbacteria bacterium RIFCSPLOWO2_12_FULL_41_11]
MVDTYFKSRLLYKKKKRRNFRPVILISLAVLIGVAVIAYGIFSLANMPYWQIKNISVTGFEIIEQDELYAAIQEPLDGYIWKFIPKSQYFFLPEEEISEHVKNKFAKIGQVSVEKKFPDILTVVVEERKVFAIYCPAVNKGSTTIALAEEAAIETKSGSKCFYIDRGGVIFELSISFAGTVFPIIENDEDMDFVVGKPAISREVLNFFEEANSALKEKTGFTLSSLTISKDISKDYILGTNFGWFLIVPRDVLPSDWSANLKTIIDSKIKTRIGDLDYVDLRFGSKIFYKFKR